MVTQSDSVRNRGTEPRLRSAHHHSYLLLPLCYPSYMTPKKLRDGKELLASLPEDLSGVDLTDANLAGVDLSDSWMGGALLAGSDFSEAHLVGADLRNTVCRSTIFNDADLHHVNFWSSDLSGSQFIGAVLSRS